MGMKKLVLLLFSILRECFPFEKILDNNLLFSRKIVGLILYTSKVDYNFFLEVVRLIRIAITISEIIHASCPGGFALVRDGQCRGQYSTITKPWDDILTTSISKCSEIQGQPVIIRNEEVRFFLSINLILIHSGAVILERTEERESILCAR